MSKEKIKINPDKFARAVIAGSKFESEGDIEISKEALKRYLTAYLLIEDFNKLEAEPFKFSNSSNFEYLIKALDKIKLNQN
ncbi:hypothetical protein [Companilactobacillus sp. HBUAS59544]|uniref:hypothetical protein n=1 Tax=Companilactobacillus sp. HBUAS59544 TaxID=3109363 RepID=UPI002FEE8B66